MKIFLMLLMLLSSAQAKFIRDDTKDVVLDTTTNLMFQDDATPSIMNWTSAVSYCENINLGTYSDWRLPNISELNSMLDFSTYNPAVDKVFKNIVLNHYWSSTTRKADITYALDVNFISAAHHNELKTDSIYVRCVRAGQ